MKKILTCLMAVFITLSYSVYGMGDEEQPLRQKRMASDVVGGDGAPEKFRKLNQKEDEEIFAGLSEYLKSQVEAGEARGKEEGIAEGEKAKTLEIARNLLSLSLSIDVIGQATGLSKEEIMQLQQEMEQQGNAHASSAPGSMDVDLSRSKPSEEE